MGKQKGSTPAENQYTLKQSNDDDAGMRAIKNEIFAQRYIFSMASSIIEHCPATGCGSWLPTCYILAPVLAVALAPGLSWGLRLLLSRLILYSFRPFIEFEREWPFSAGGRGKRGSLIQLVFGFHT